MPNTYTQLILQFVFAVEHRKALIHEEIRERVEKYLTGIAQNKGHKLLAIYCLPDHCHLVTGVNPNQSISDFARDLKSNSAKWINNEKLLPFKFQWQEGHGCFSYSRSQLDKVVNYVLNQPEHHMKKTFKEEYHEFLDKFQIEYDERYLFRWMD